MADTLLLHFDPATPERACWSLVNTQGELTSKLTFGSLSDATPIANSHKLIVLLDSTCLHINNINLPTKNKQQMLRAAPFALEDQIADEVEDFHFVVNNNDSKKPVNVVGIKKATLDNILNKFSAADLKPEAIVPDAICLPADTQQWAVLFFEDNVYLQCDYLFGNVYDRNTANLILESQLDDEESVAPEKLLAFTIDGENSDKIKDSLKEIEEINITYNAHPLVIFSGNYKKSLALNLLQDAYKPKREGSFQLQQWGLAASLAAVWLVLHLGITAFQAGALENENNNIVAQVEKIYKKTFPRSKKIVNARVQMEQKLKALKGGGGGNELSLLTLLTESSRAISKEKGIKLDSLNFRNQSLDLGIESPTLQAIESLNKTLNSNRQIKSEISSSSSDKNKVKGKLRISGRKS